MQHKSLAQLIEQNLQLDCVQKYTLFKNICNQIEKIHKENMTYKYLCPENIFVDGNMNVFLKDFEESEQAKKELINWSYSSPEILMSFRDPQNSEISSKADIWSIGLLLNVVFTMKNIVQVRGRIGFVANSEYFFEIISLCMKSKPEERPTCSQLCSFLEDYEQNYLQLNSNDMRSAFNCFKQERYISSTLKLQRLDSSEQYDEIDELEIKSSNLELEDIKLEYRNFSFHAQSKNDNENLYILIQDRPLKITQNKIIKADDYEIIVAKLDNKEGLINLEVKLSPSEQVDTYEYTLNNDEYLQIGADEGNQISLPFLSEDSSLLIIKQQDGFYIKQYSNLTDSSMSSIDSGRVYIKLEKNTPIYNQSIICSENQKYFVKSIC